MTNIPSFELMQVDLTEQEYQSELATAKAATGKMYRPGTYDLIIKEASWHKANQHDPSWFGLQLVLGDNVSERKIRQYVSVPTKSVRYNKPGIKNPLSLFIMFREFVEALGMTAQVDEVPELLKTVFSDLQGELVGRSINVTIGYKGPYIERLSQTEFKVLDKDGRDYKLEGVEGVTFPNRESAIAELMLKHNLDLSRVFPEIVKLNKPEVNDDF